MISITVSRDLKFVLMFRKLIYFYLRETVEFYIVQGGIWGPEDVERC